MKYILILILTVILAGCAGAESGYVKTTPDINLSGMYHSVGAGQTLWSIAKTYGVDLDYLAKINHIQDSSRLTAGQQIFIPGAKQTLAVPSKIAKLEDFIWPVRGNITFYFGSMVDNVLNKGIDITVSDNQKVFASSSGKIIFIGKSLAGYGNTVIIDHGNNISTVYGNLNEIIPGIGARVKQGDTIASLREGDCFHFEVRERARAVNPLYYLP